MNISQVNSDKKLTEFNRIKRSKLDYHIYLSNQKRSEAMILLEEKNI